MKRAVLLALMVALGVAVLSRRDGQVSLPTGSGASISPPHHSGAVYFQREPSAGVINPERLAREFDTTSVAAWSEVTALDSAAPIALLIVDPGSQAQVDWPWVGQRLGCGLILVGVNVPLGAYLPGLGDEDLMDENDDLWRSITPDHQSGEFYSMASHLVFGVPAARTAIAADPKYDLTATTEDCMGEVYGVNEDSAVEARSGIPDFVFIKIHRVLNDNAARLADPCGDGMFTVIPIIDPTP